MNLLFLLTVCVLQLSGQEPKAKTNKPDPHCGAKCLYVLLRERGVGPADFKSLERSLGPSSRDGYSLLQLQNEARKFGLFAECFRLTQDQLAAVDKIHQGVVMHFEPGHFSICQYCGPDRLLMYDASFGRPDILPSSALKKWTGNVLIVSSKEIVLDQPAISRNWIWWSCGAAGTLCLLSLAWRRFRSAACLIPLLCLLCIESGCSETETAKQATPQSASSDAPVQSDLWIEKGEIDVEPVNIVENSRVVKIQLENRGSRKIKISEVRMSCHCATVLLPPNTEIEAGKNVTLPISLDCTHVGMQGVTLTLFDDRTPLGQVKIRWSVFAGLTTSPKSLYEIELGQQSVSTSKLVLDTNRENVDLKQVTSKATYDAVNREFASLIEFSSQFVDEKTLEIKFTAKGPLPRSTIGGHFDLQHPEHADVKAVVPFRIVIRNPVDIAPDKLFLIQENGKLKGQLVITAENVQALDPMELGWSTGDDNASAAEKSAIVGSSVAKSSDIECTYEVEDRPGLRIVELTLPVSESSGVKTLKLRLGDYQPAPIPVILP